MTYYLQDGVLGDLETIYPILKNEFLEEELKSEDQVRKLFTSGSYKIILLKSGSDLLGFVCLLEIEPTNIMWIDYIVICESYRSKGIGSIFMKLLIEKLKNFDGIFFEVEMPDSADESTRQKQLNRIKFYEKFGAQLILDQYLLPHEEGAFPMWMYAIPCSDAIKFDKMTVFESISFVFDVIHADIEGRKSVFEKIIYMNEKSASPN